MNIDHLSEDDISVKYITTALHKAGWDEETQIRRQVSFTKGRIIVRGKLVSRGKPKKADFVLYYQHVPIALIEAKKSKLAEGPFDAFAALLREMTQKCATFIPQLRRTLKQLVDELPAAKVEKLEEVMVQLRAA